MVHIDKVSRDLETKFKRKQSQRTKSKKINYKGNRKLAQYSKLCREEI